MTTEAGTGTGGLPTGAAVRPPSNEVHVWHVPLGASSEGGPDLSALSSEEHARAAAYRRPAARLEFVASRAALRTILGAYLRLPAQQVDLRAGPAGKPHLAPGAPGPLQFNLSHDGALTLVAIATARRVGVDVERAALLPEQGAIAARHFSSEEQRLLDRWPDPPTFALLWTRREAWLKADGVGLGGLTPENGPPAPPHPHATETWKSWAREGTRWSIISLRLPEDRVAAVVIEGDPPVLQMRSLPLINPEPCPPP